VCGCAFTAFLVYVLMNECILLLIIYMSGCAFTAFLVYVLMNECIIIIIDYLNVWMCVCVCVCWLRVFFFISLNYE